MRFTRIILLAALGLPAVATDGWAQFGPTNNRRNYPLNQRTPPGVAGHWARMLGRTTPGYLQPVEIRLPGKVGTVTFHQPSQRLQKSLAAPALARMTIGPVYRVQISGFPKHPGVSLYPTIELIDRLHPPPGKADRFPIPIEFTIEEIELALNGRMVTKVVYLEQPQLAIPKSLPLATTTMPANQNLLEEADRRGRPMAIVRMGGRQPTATNALQFFGVGGPLQLVEK